MSDAVSINQGTKPPAMVEHEKKMALIGAGKDPLIAEAEEEQASNQLLETGDMVQMIETLTKRLNVLEPQQATPAKSVKPQIVVKVENEHIEFQFMAYEFFVEDFTIPILVDKDSFQAMPKSQQGFVLTIDGESYPVIFIGRPVHFNTIDMGVITFMKDPDRE